ncbi:MAG: hypothetical protein L3J07_03675 [Candidatus Magasanikbacteria bacterium]|nr:hypothetical protein [Candidatus Magasanikbacteria bacterium]
MGNPELRSMSLEEAERKLNTEIAGEAIQKQSEQELLKKMDSINTNPDALKNRREKAMRELLEKNAKDREKQKNIDRNIQKQKEREEGTAVEQALSETRKVVNESIISDKEQKIIKELEKVNQSTEKDMQTLGDLDKTGIFKPVTKNK